MILPNKDTEFKSIAELPNYCENYACIGLVFSPETENDHFNGCPPYIEMAKLGEFNDSESIYFEIPYPVAYYARVHAGFTMEGRKDRIQQGRIDLANDIKKLLNIKN